MLIEDIELYKSKIQSKIFSLSQEMGSIALIGGDIENKCLLELFSILSILSFSESTDSNKEELLSYLIWKYELSEVDVLPFTFPNVEYISDGFNSALYYTKSEIDVIINNVDPVFPPGTPNVNVSVGGWFAGYVLAGKRVINALIDLGVQFVNPSTSLSLTSPSSVERGTTITSISVNRVRNLGSDTFVGAVYTQPNVADVTDNEGTPNARSFTGISINANNTTNIVGGIPVHVITLVTDYAVSANETDTVSISFISPVYFGCLASGSVNVANVQALSKASLLNSRVRAGLLFTTNSNRPIYAYPSRLGELTSITDNFGNQLIGAFTSSVVPNFTFPDSPNENYRVYVYNSDVSPSTIVFNFNA